MKKRKKIKVEEITEQLLKNMKLLENIEIGDEFVIHRVVGGWIYWWQVRTGATSTSLAGVFVPEP